MKKIALALIIVLGVINSFAQAANQLDTAKYFSFVEVMPQYKGDINMKQLAPDIISQMKQICPIQPDSNKILIHFIIETDGTVKKAIVLRGICDEMNAQAIEEIKKQIFTPGQQNGVKVRVKMAVMLKFKQ